MHIANFNALQANLNEIYAAISGEPKNQLLALYANSPSTVYYQGCWMGKIVEKWDKAWHWIQPMEGFSVDKTLEFILTTLFNQAVHLAYDVRQRRIWNNMRQIDQIWKNQLQPQDFAKQQKRYEKYLEKELKGSIEANNPIFMVDFNQRKIRPLSAREEGILRHTIVNFHQATYDFWSLFVKKNQDEMIRMREPLMRFINASSALNDRILFKALKKEGRWVQMEGIMHQPIPVVLFAKLHDPNSLTIDENRQLKFWIQTLNSRKEISLKLLSTVLDEVINVIQLQGSSSVTLTDLIFWLDQHGCQLFHQEDSAHMDKREKLLPGNTIECNGQKLILGDQLSPKRDIDDTYKIFELANYPDYVVKIACNRFLLLIEEKRAQSEQEHWGVRLVETIDNLEQDLQKPVIKGLDQQGRCVVLEKLLPAFDSHIWTSEDVKLSKEDEKLALVFANHVFCMCQWKSSAQNLSLSHLMWDKKGVLKSTRLFKKGPPNYNEWETYCENAAKGNPFILSFLMNVSTLSKHDIGRYYREAVEYTLRTGETDLIGRPLPLGHRQDVYTKHVKTLCSQAEELRKSCFNYVVAQLRKQNRYSHKQEKQLREEVADKLLELYQASPTPGRLSPNLQQEVVMSLSNSSFKKPLILDSLHQAYYKEKHELMMKYNQAILKPQVNIKVK